MHLIRGFMRFRKGMVCVSRDLRINIVPAANGSHLQRVDPAYALRRKGVIPQFIRGSIITGSVRLLTDRFAENDIRGTDNEDTHDETGDLIGRGKHVS